MTCDPAGARSRCSQQRSRRLSLPLAAALLLLGVAAPVRAEVIPSGDVLPDGPDAIPEGGGTVSGDIIVGGTGDMINDTEVGSLRIDAPAFTLPLISDRGVIGDEATGSGTVSIFSAGSEWRIRAVDDGLIVGRFGRGLLELVNGGLLSDDPPSVVTSNNLEVIVGQQTGSQGFVDVRGSSSVLRSAQLSVGQGGFGQMTISGTATVETLERAVIGEINTGVSIGTGFVSVDGALSRWTVGSTAAGGPIGNLVVGGAGRGALNITNRAEVRVTSPSPSTSGNVIICESATGLGEVTVNGLFSQLWAFGSIAISNGSGGRGALYIQNQGLVRANNGVTIGPNGLLELAGGALFTPTTRRIDNSGVIRTAVGNVGQIDSRVDNLAFGEIRSAGTADRVRERLLFTRPVNNRLDGLITSIGGEMEFTDVVTNDSGGIIAGRDAVYRFRGGLNNNGILAFSVGASDVFGEVTNNSSGVIGVANKSEATFYDDVMNAGKLSVQKGGTAIFIKDLDFAPSSVLSVHLSELASVEMLAQIDVTGNLSLGGVLNVFIEPDLTPEPGDRFQIISGANISGTFASAIFSPPPPGANWNIIYSPTSVILAYVASVAFSGDFDGDGFVDADDLLIWKANFGLSPATMAQGDANGDGRVDGSDWMIWSTTLGPVPAVAATSPVPEPGSAALLLIALAGWRRLARTKS